MADGLPRAAHQLDPFAFPSETKGRFLMLVVAALAFAATLGSLLMVAISGPSQAGSISEVTGKAMRSWATINPSHLSSADLEIMERDIVPVFRNGLRVQIKRLAFPFMMMLLVVTCAFGLRRIALVRLRRRKAFTLTKVEAPTVVSDLENIAEREGIDCPRLEYNIGLAQGHAFGLCGSEVLVLCGGPDLLEQSWSMSGRAIALHELAHVINRDASDRERASAIWQALVLILVIYFVFLSILGARYATGFWLKTALMLLLVRLIGAGLIRVREYYADWRSMSWGVGATLLRLLMLRDCNADPWEGWGWWWWSWNRWGDRNWWIAAAWASNWIWRYFKYLVGYHPSFAARRRALSDPISLFSIAPDLSVHTGLLLSFLTLGLFPFLFEITVTELDLQGLGYANVLRHLASLPVGLIRDLMAGSAMMLYAMVPIFSGSIVFFGAAYLIARTLGLQVQREAVAQLVTGERLRRGYVRLLMTAALFVLGIEIGFAASPVMPVLPRTFGLWTYVPWWATGMIVLIFAWLSYIYYVSICLLGSYSGRKVPRRRQRYISWTSAAILAMIYWPALLGRLTILSLTMLNGASASATLFGVAAAVIATLMALALVLGAFGFLFLITFLAFRLKPLRYSAKCSFCGMRSDSRIVLGRLCRGCGRCLSPWLFSAVRA